MEAPHDDALTDVQAGAEARAEAGTRDGMGRPTAVTVVAVASAAVLVLEVLSVRLVAPFAGLTLETYTASIGVALGAIAFGAALGGRAADAVPPLTLVGPLLVTGGALFMLARPIVLGLGPAMRGAGPLGALILVGAGITVPVAVLSALPPMVVKTQLSRLDETGTVVGRYSALGTLGALAGTFLTGYVLLVTLPVSRVLLVAGGILVALGGWLTVRYGSWRSRAPQGAALVLVAAGGLVAVPAPCDYETPYYCARVLTDPAREGGRLLMLDDLRHAYVDLDDPRYLEFAYAQRMADVIEEMAPPARPLTALHVGGGGFTMPRWLEATRPSSRSRVLEIDPVVVRLGRERLGLRTGPGLEVRVGDARQGIAEEPSGGYDLVIGDAFGSLSVPWHLATREFVQEVRRVLRPGGLYLLNVIDNPPLRFLGAELATIQAVFPQVTVVATAAGLAGTGGGNFVVVAGTELPDRQAVAARVARHPMPAHLASPAQVAELRGAARPLTDDEAPVDQLLTPYRPASEAVQGRPGQCSHSSQTTRS
jgi:spermidine synthase